jgi:hypothetical protein
MMSLHDIATVVRPILSVVFLAGGTVVTLLMSFRAIRHASVKRDEIFGDPLE